MKKVDRWAALTAALLLTVSLAPASQAAEAGEKIVILHTNDVHCALDDAIGYAGLAAYAGALEEQYGADRVTLVDAGDAIQGQAVGTLSQGEYIISLMNAAGYDLAVPGNHEFDYGVDRLMELAAGAEFPYLSCNFTGLAAGEPVFPPLSLLDYGGTPPGHGGVAARLEYPAQRVRGDPPAEADIGLCGSFATTGRGHGTDRALVAGLLGLRPDDPRLPDSFALAEEAGMKFTIHPVELRAAHPNTAVLTLKSKAGRTLVLKAASVGGGRIRVTEIDGVPADFGGDSNTLIIHNEDTPGCIAEVTMSLAQRRINIASMQVFRAATGGYAVMVLECDSHIPHVLEQQMAVMPGIRKVTCLNIDEPEECEEG